MALKKERKDTDLVELSMTEGEKAEYLAYKLEKDKTAKADTAKVEGEGFVEMNLLKPHSYNRYSFGPGLSRVPAGLAGQVAWIEEKARNQELSLNTENKRLVEIMMSGQTIPRPIK